MPNPINVSDATMRATRDARLSLVALLDYINIVKDTPEIFDDLLIQLSSLDIVLRRISLASNGIPSMATQEVQTYLRLIISNCEKACDEFGKEFRKFVDRTEEGLVHRFNPDRFANIGEIEVQFLNERLDRWKDVVFVTVEFSLVYARLASSSMSETINQERASALLTRENDTSHLIDRMDRGREALQGKGATLNRIVLGIEEQAIEIDQSRTFLDRLHSELHYLRTGQRIESCNGGRLLVGTMGPLNGSHQISQMFNNVTVGGNGRAVVGVVRNFDINAFFR